MEFHRGRLFDHVHLRVRDLEASKRFYRAVLGVVGVPVLAEGKDSFGADELYISPGDAPTQRMHLAFQAADRDMVHRFHKRWCTTGPPGARPRPSS